MLLPLLISLRMISVMDRSALNDISVQSNKPMTPLRSENIAQPEIKTIFDRIYYYFRDNNWQKEVKYLQIVFQ